MTTLEEDGIMKDEILALRKLGHFIAEIVHITGYRLHTVCEIIYNENNKDKQS